jgi:hypothetical protein
MLWRREFLTRLVHEEEEPEKLQMCAKKGHRLMLDSWELMKAMRQTDIQIFPITFPSSGHPTLDQAVRHFCNGNIAQTEQAIRQPGQRFSFKQYSCLIEF